MHSLSSVVYQANDEALKYFESMIGASRNGSAMNMLVALHEPMGGFWRIVNYRKDATTLRELQKKGFSICAVQYFTEESQGSKNFPSLSDAKIKISEKIKEIKQDLLWLECALERNTLYGDKLSLPCTFGVTGVSPESRERSFHRNSAYSQYEKLVLPAGNSLRLRMELVRASGE